MELCLSVEALLHHLYTSKHKYSERKALLHLWTKGIVLSLGTFQTSDKVVASILKHQVGLRTSSSHTTGWCSSWWREHLTAVLQRVLLGQREDVCVEGYHKLSLRKKVLEFLVASGYLGLFLAVFLMTYPVMAARSSAFFERPQRRTLWLPLIMNHPSL